MRLILKKWKICFVPRRYWVENLHWMKGRQAIQPDIRIDYDFLREVEIYVPDIEYRTCFCSSQDIGESWWPSKCCEWTFGLKPGYQQVRELVRKQRREVCLREKNPSDPLCPLDALFPSLFSDKLPYTISMQTTGCHGGSDMIAHHGYGSSLQS